MAGISTGALDSQSRGIVTPEAVLLEFEPARVGTRSLQMGLDLLVQLVGFFVVVFVLGAVGSFGSLSDTVAIIFVTIMVFLLLIGYPCLMETFNRGRTLGMMAVGLRVTTIEGAPVRFRHTAIRAFLMLVDFWLAMGGIGAIVMLSTRNSQRLGDLAAGTLVLRERTAAKVDSPTTFLPPTGWEPYAASLDAGLVTEQQYGLVRAFLLRVHDLLPAARYQLALRLAAGLELAMRHRAPQGTHPEPFLICVAAAYQRLHSGGEPAWGPDGPLGAYAAVHAPPWQQPGPPLAQVGTWAAGGQQGRPQQQGGWSQQPQQQGGWPQQPPTVAPQGQDGWQGPARDARLSEPEPKPKEFG